MRTGIFFNFFNIPGTSLWYVQQLLRMYPIPSDAFFIYDGDLRWWQLCTSANGCWLPLFLANGSMATRQSYISLSRSLARSFSLVYNSSTTVVVGSMLSYALFFLSSHCPRGILLVVLTYVNYNSQRCLPVAPSIMPVGSRRITPIPRPSRGLLPS